MAGRNARATRPGGSPRQSAPWTGAKGSSEQSAALALPVLGERHRFHCEPCDHEADATYKRDRDGFPGWRLGSSHVDRCPKGRDCLALLSDWLGPPPAKLLEDPRCYLPADASQERQWTWREPLMSDAAWSRGKTALRGSGACADARRYLRTRGIEPSGHDLIYALRWGHPAIGARCYAGGHVVTEVYRFYDRERAPLDRKGESMKDSMLRRGEGSAGWIGGVPPGERGTLLVAGFLDGLVALQNGLPAISASCGATLPDHLLGDLAGRRVAVAYDVGEEAAAERAVKKLHAAGTDAWVVRLGLEPGGDLTDWYEQGRTTHQLVTLIRRERRAT